jgi:hypothetical protein
VLTVRISGLGGPGSLLLTHLVSLSSGLEMLQREGI